jgi:type III restriction enzyme
MSIVVKFESNQDYQTEAIESVVNLFDSLPNSDGAFVVSDSVEEDLNDGQLFRESLFGNGFAIGNEDRRDLIIKNLALVQSRTRQSSSGEAVPIIPPENWSNVVDEDQLTEFSIEMETGTGKTYVYLRTAIELYLKYGLSKFVIVVPSVAIREGVLSTLRMTKSHFEEVYAGIQMDSYSYDSKNVNKLRQFATSKHLQILVMNIASFHKDTNIIKKEADGLNGRAPIEFIQAVRPVVIMDEPQKLGSELQEAAITELNPLFKLRYSATHREHHHRLYCLNPIDAYNMRLVKRIDVLSVTAPDNENVAFVEISKITASSGSVTATAVVNKTSGRKNITLRRNTDLKEETNLAIYDGWVVEDIHATTDEAPGYVEFQNGRVLRLNSSTGVELDLWHRELIRAAIEEHFSTELKLMQQAAIGVIQPTKPLTLFFIDRVANYVGNEPKFHTMFEEEYLGVQKDRRFRSLEMPDAKDVHRGYFSSSKGQAKDSKEDRTTKDDEDAYDLIMKDKERLLSLEEPVRFIFSHSALAEGWDNPNVFTICNLQQVQSEVKRRQQIGRGLRLPVMANGERCRVEDINHLTVIANENFEKFAAGLQKDIRDETGYEFKGLIKDKRNRVTLLPKPDFEKIEGFQELWNAIAPKTTYRLDFQTDELVKEAVDRLKKDEKIDKPKFTITRKGIVGFEAEMGVIAGDGHERARSVDMVFSFPDILGEVASEVPVSRATIKRVIEESGRLKEGTKNPAQFRKQVVIAVRHALAHTLKEQGGVKYSPRVVGSDLAWDMDYFSLHHAEAYIDNLVDVSKSIYHQIPVDSEVERQFALDLDQREDVVLFVKLPDWYKVSTPVGSYNPDWAIVRKEETDLSLYLVRETKGSSNLDDLFREAEIWKVTFGRSHFDAIGVDYKVVHRVTDLDEDNPEVLVD